MNLNLGPYDCQANALIHDHRHHRQSQHSRLKFFHLAKTKESLKFLLHFSCEIPSKKYCRIFTYHFNQLTIKLFVLLFSKQALVFICLQYKPLENTEGKGEIACNEQFLLFPKCFLSIWRTFCHVHQISNCRLQTLSVRKSLKFVVWDRVNKQIFLVSLAEGKT